MKRLELIVLVNNRYDKEDIERIINSINDAGSYLVKEAAIEGVQYIKDEGFDKVSMKKYTAYEFGLDKFSYYALIKARTQREAINFYQDVVADINNSATPECFTGIDNICKRMNRKKCWIADIKKEDVLNVLEHPGPQLLLWDACLN